MQVSLVDKWRNVTITRTNIAANPFDTLDELIGNQGDGNGQLEFHCDQEFMDTLTNWNETHADCKLIPAEASGRSTDVGNGHIIHHPVYEGIPIVVSGA